MLLAGLLAVLGLFVCVSNWRWGLPLCLVIGFLQDPLRKITPGQPVAFVVLVGVFFVGCVIGFLLDEGLSGLKGFMRWYPGLRTPMLLFTLLVIAQSGMALVNTGNPVVAGIGLLSYLSPMVALLLGQRYCSTAASIGRWQKVYLAGALTVGASILLSFFGVSSPLFESIGDTTVYGRGGRVEMVSGLLRSSETAAWHVTTAACLVIIWSVARRRSRAFWIGAATTLALLLAVVLTGRRKTLGELLLFLLVFGVLIMRSTIGASRLLRMASGLAFGAAALVVLLSGGGRKNPWEPYLERSLSVVSDAPERLQSMALSNIYYVVAENGFFGRGAGTGAQGAQYFGGGAQLVGWGAEGGLGRIAAELGVPGLIIVVWLSTAVAIRLWRVARILPRVAPRHAVRFYGLFALIPANAIVFLTAHQVFGDPFVLITLGLIASSALAFPQIAARERELAARSDLAARARRDSVALDPMRLPVSG